MPILPMRAQASVDCCVSGLDGIGLYLETLEKYENPDNLLILVPLNLPIDAT